MSITTLYHWNTEYSADSVEWCPIPPHQNVFVCGTYQIITNEKETCTESEEAKSYVSNSPVKLGKLYLFSFTFSDGPTLLQTLEGAGILDMKWCHSKIYDHIILAVANAHGIVTLYELLLMENEHCNYSLKLVCNIAINDSEIGCLALSLDWCTGRSLVTDWCIDKYLLTVSDSKGYITVIKLSENFTYIEEHKWRAHDFEAWITAFDYWNTSVIYTGGDDCKFKIYDVRHGTDQPVFVSRAHSAGVTSLQSNPFEENVIISGSYDEQLRVWDARNFKQPLNMLCLGGGIWRLKWDPQSWKFILAASMHNGFQVIKYDNNHVSPPVVVTEYNEHESLAYGCDWCHITKSDLKFQWASGNVGNITEDREKLNFVSLLATCSFYDHKLCISVFHTLDDF